MLLSSARLIIGFAILLTTLCATSSTSQLQQEQPPQDQVSSQQTDPLGKLKQQLDSDTKLDPTIKEKIQSAISTAELNATALAAKKTDILQLENASQTAEQRAKQFQSEFERLKSQPAPTTDNNIPNDQLNELLQKLKPEVEDLKSQLKKNEQSSTTRLARRQDSRQAVDVFTKRIEELKSQLTTAENDTSLAGQATFFKIQTELKLAELEQKALQAELNRDEAEEQAGLLKSQHDLLELKLELSEARQTELEDIQRLRLERTAKQLLDKAIAQQSKIEALDDKNALKLLLPSYKINTEIAKRVQEVELNASNAKTKADLLKTTVDNLNKKFDETKIRVKKIGLTGSVGALLRKRKEELIDAVNLGKFNAVVKSKIDELEFERFDFDDQRKELSPTSIQLEIEETFDAQATEVWQELESPINEVIEIRKEYLNSVTNSLNRLFDQQLNVQQYDASRRATATRFREYINERILWIRSNNVLFSEFKIDSSDGLILDSSKWNEALHQIVQALGLAAVEKKNPLAATSVVTAKDKGLIGDQSIEKPETRSIFSATSYLRLPLTLVSALICFLLIFYKSRMRKEVDRLGAEAARGSCVSFWPTAHSLYLSILIALALPMVPLLLGLAIVYAPLQGNVLFYAIGRALIAASLFAIPAEVLRRMSRPQGIGNQHFDWPDASVAKLKQNLDWIVLPGSLLIFVVSLLHNLDLSHRVDLLERIVFVGGMLFATYFLHRTYNSKNGVFSGYFRANEKSWANQTSAIWLGLILLIPVSLAFLAFWGYYYTALNLAECAYATLVFGLVVETIRGLARRFVLVRRRNAFIQTARRKRQARIEAAQLKREEERKLAIAAAAEGGTPLPETTAAPTESIETLAEIQPEEIEENVEQAYKLISMTLLLVWAIGIWMIWTDVLPALKALDDYTLWPNQVVENGFESQTISATAPEAESGTNTETSTEAAAMTGMPGASSDAVSQPLQRVTVRDLLLFIVISIVTWIAAKNLPNAFEILFLEELPFDRSFRYAIKALTSYAIVMLGVVLAFRALSIGWSNVQWLATALTFGLAFGLQEIFANFVAGIILMFERPMRIGDLITVDQFTGVVTKIRTRATTIINWDRKEYVIPNKDFITGRLVNWTLSDAINRIELTVGIAYGSDVELAKNTLYGVLKKHPKIVTEPAAQVIFSEFGDSSLNFNVKCFIGDVDSRPRVIDSLHTQIYKALNEAGIEISFPQRDLNLRSIDGNAIEAINNASNKK